MITTLALRQLRSRCVCVRSYLAVAALVAAVSAVPNATQPAGVPTQNQEVPDVGETGTPVMQFAGELWRACEDGDLNARWVGESGNSHCYMLFNKKKTWFSARRSCENLNGHLVTVTR